MAAPQKKTQADVAADRKKQILAAAVEVFAERGFHRTRVSDIAKRAGVAYGLIYHYFDSKDAVLNAVFEENWNVF
jgi:AcrR family transcriptional regulator